MNRNTAIIGAFISGILIYLAVLHAVPFLVWIALIPLFLVLNNPAGNTFPSSAAIPNRSSSISGRTLSFLPPRHSRSHLPSSSLPPGHSRCSFPLPFIATATFSILAFAWMIPGAHAFTGGSIGYGIILFLLCASIFAFGCATLLWLTPPALIAPVWILAEMILQWAAEKMPWFLFHIGNALASNLYAIQPVSVIGVAGAGFIVIEVNYLTARAILRKNRKYAGASLLLFTTYMLWGWWLLPPDLSKANSLALSTSTGQHPPSLSTPAGQNSTFTLSLLRESIPPEIPWDQTNGNQRVHELLQQEDQCIALHPQMILWSESAIPWTYSPDDDLVRELLHRCRQQSITHILGMNTAVSTNTAASTGINTAISTGINTGISPSSNTTLTRDVVRNSAYCLLPDGKLAGRYDKRKPLLFIEQPGPGSWLMPFSSSGGYSVEPGDSDAPLITPYGKAGVLICNESALPGAAASRVRQGAQFLVNMSNDGWFRDTWLVSQHFYNARLRAVETRKDMAVNSNNGWSGCIYASGRIDRTAPIDRTTPTDRTTPIDPANRTDTAGTVFTIHPNDDRPIAVRYPLLPAYICLFFLLITILKTKLL